MVIISKTIIKNFSKQHIDAEVALQNWYKEAKNADWKNFTEVKRSFNTVDSVGNDRYVFDIKGNHYRLITLIIFKARTVFILFIGTHKEYDKLNAANTVFKKQKI